MAPITTRKHVKDDKSVNLEEGDVPEAPKTRSPTTKRAPRRGKLAQLPSLPLDILFEIFGHLRPIDVLHLSRTSKSFCEVLLHTNATSLWKRVYANPEMEDTPCCPEDVSLPVWTNLLFDHRCHNCLAPNVTWWDSALWALRIRVCADCCKPSRSVLISEKNVKKDNAMFDLVSACIPFQRRNYVNYCLKRDLDALLEELKLTEGNSEARSAFVEKRKAEVEDRMKKSEECMAWFVKRMKARDEEIVQIRKERHDFIRSRLLDKGYQEEFAFIDEHTSRDDGAQYGPDVLAFTILSDVQEAVPITERIWNGRVKKELVEYMEEVKAFRLSHERRKIIDRRGTVFAEAWVWWIAQEAQHERYDLGCLFPTLMDVIEHPTVQTLLNQPGDDDISRPQCISILDNFHTAIAEWQAEQSAALFKLVPRSVFETDPTGFLQQFLDGREDHKTNLKWMSRAAIVFRCKHSDSRIHETAIVVDDPTREYAEPPTWEDNQCHARRSPYQNHMWFPEYLHHSCCTLRTANSNERWFGWSPYYNVDRMRVHSEMTLRRSKFNIEALEFDEKASKLVKKIAQVCGVSLSKSVLNLDYDNPRIVCLNCIPGGKISPLTMVTVRTWRTMIKHIMEKHWGSTSVRMQPLKTSRNPMKNDKLHAEEKEQLEGHRHDSLPRRYVRCLLCRHATSEAGPMSLDALKIHALREHGVKAINARPLTTYTFNVWETAPYPPREIKMELSLEYP